MGDFAAAAAQVGVAHYVRPNYPQGQGRVERSFLSDVLEHYEVAGYPRDVDEAERHLVAWNAVYEDIRPYQALGYLTPNEFYAKWLAEQASRKAACPTCLDLAQDIDFSVGSYQVERATPQPPIGLSPARSRRDRLSPE